MGKSLLTVALLPDGPPPRPELGRQIGEIFQLVDDFAEGRPDDEGEGAEELDQLGTGQRFLRRRNSETRRGEARGEEGDGVCGGGGRQARSQLPPTRKGSHHAKVHKVTKPLTVAGDIFKDEGLRIREAHHRLAQFAPGQAGDGDHRDRKTRLEQQGQLRANLEMRASKSLRGGD